ncbi:MAG: chorismate lyase, partial [Xanthomonadales bacterium]|nr:chorismate lyase [Xanthomonadales bacterium]
PVLRRWLTYEGLLTVRMKSACGSGFRLQLLERAPGALVDQNPSRRVILRCQEHACVYAESYLPREVLAVLPGLKNLGGDPLGEALQDRPDVARSAFEYALIRSPVLPAEIGLPNSPPLWARRSRFVVEGVSLLVAEVFLPAMEEMTP